MANRDGRGGQRSIKMVKGRTKERPWNPNSQSFDEGRPYVEQQLKKVGLRLDAGILTSKDAKAKKLRKLLAINNTPPGFTKWQLPFAFLEPTNTYVTEGKPGASVAGSPVGER